MDQKSFKALLKILRDNGVTNYVTPELELTIAPEFISAPNQQPRVVEKELATTPIEDPWAEFPGGELSPDELAFYSSGGKPGTYNKNS